MDEKNFSVKSSHDTVEGLVLPELPKLPRERERIVAPRLPKLPSLAKKKPQLPRAISAVGQSPHSRKKPSAASNKQRTQRERKTVKKTIIRKKAKAKRKMLVNRVKNTQTSFLRKPPETEKDIAMDFASKVQRKFDRMIKASVLFGSQAKMQGTAMVGSDIDIILIVDDAVIEWDLELVAWYREELGKLVASQKYGKDLHINTVRLTTWWEDLLHGDPVVVNVLRYGEALIDYGGFFNPIKALLLKGKIKSTPEAVYAALRRAPGHIVRSKLSEMSAIEGSYWAMVDSAQAALMTAGKMPPSPEHIPDMLYETFVQNGILKIHYVRDMKELYTLHKAIAHGQLNDIKGREIDEWQELAEKFLVEMSRIIDRYLEEK